MSKLDDFKEALANIDPDAEKASHMISDVLLAYAEWMEEAQPAAVNSISAARQAGDEASGYWEDIEAS